MADERPATVEDINHIRDEIRDIRNELTRVMEALGHVRVEIAKSQGDIKGDTRVVETKTVIIWVILAAIGSAMMPVIIQRLLPATLPTPQPVIIQQPVPTSKK